MAASKALEAWQELNERQQGTMSVIYELDQEAEAGRRSAGAAGTFDRRPASEWRRIDFATDPHGFATTEMQIRLAYRGWHNQGNGSTIKALADRGLITEGSRPIRFGRMLTVMLTREGRAAARAGLAMPAAPKTALAEWAWEVLVSLWKADQRGEYVRRHGSGAIDNVLIAKHVPPLAEPVDPGKENGYRGGYRITDRGRWFYREFYSQNVTAHPNVRAPHPDGAAAEPWPPRADEIIAAHRALYRALRDQWQAATAARQATEAEAAAPAPELPDVLPAEVADQARERYEAWTATARQRSELAAAHTADLASRAERAARGYAVAALAAFRAAALRTDPLEVIQPPGDADDWDEPRLAPPAETGIHVIDAEAKKLHADAAGAPLPRRGPAPRQRRRRYALPAPPAGASRQQARRPRGMPARAHRRRRPLTPPPPRRLAARAGPVTQAPGLPGAGAIARQAIGQMPASRSISPGTARMPAAARRARKGNQ